MLRRILRRVPLALGVLALGVLVAFAVTSFFFAQRADYGWRPRITRPTFASEHPRVWLDEGHNNASTAGLTGRYWPFARLLEADGYSVIRGHERFTSAALAGVQIVVTANASGAPKPQVFGINLPIGPGGERSAPAFAPDEIEAVRAWIEHGGSLLLVADHAPFGQAAEGLAKALGVTMHKGFVEVPGESSDPLLFSRDQGRLGTHPIIDGSGPESAVKRVMTFTGQSLEGPPSSTVLLALPPTATESVPEQERFVERRAGPAQGVAFELGKGRVVVLGEAAMLTAQVSHRVPFGMNRSDNDNQQFALNVMHWLSRVL